MKCSENLVMWKTFIKFTTCMECYVRNGRVYSYDDLIIIGEPGQLHPNCGCRLERMQAIDAGTATNLGTNGADWWIKYLGELPGYYISKEYAKELGWINIKGNLSEVAPGYMVFGRYYNSENKLPDAEGRIWYEADINYNGGYRNKERVLFSNDGLIFVTYDHCETFAEIIGEEY